MTAKNRTFQVLTDAARDEQIARDQLATRDLDARGGLRRSCYLAGCPERSSVWAAFCSPQHRAIWNRLPENVRAIPAYAALSYRNDLDYTLSLVEHDAAAMGALAAAGGNT